MRILICHERFLFRFGADRVYILLAKGLRALGHEVVMLGSRFDREVVRSVASRVIELPAASGDYATFDEAAAGWVAGNWERHFGGANRTDVVVVGGWPFFSSIPFFRWKAGTVVFIDTGVVPLDGYPDATAKVLEKLHRLRRAFLCECSTIVAISEFIARSQSRPDCQERVPVRTILLAADHVATPMWSAGEVTSASRYGEAVARVRKLKERGRRLILALGRWEPGTYKNSQEAFNVLRQILSRISDATLLFLANDDDLEVPADLTGSVETLGFPDDLELTEIMAEVDLGITVSLWEGFNLPLAEIQWLGRPCLAFNVGAHPEVVAHPWFLCENSKQMGEKAVALLSGHDIPEPSVAEAFDEVRRRFTWSRVIDDYRKVFQQVPGPTATGQQAPPISFVVDVTNACADPANSGVIRVARRLGRQLQKSGQPLFVRWEESTGQYVLPVRAEFDRLASYHGPVLTGVDQLSPETAQRITLEQALQPNDRSNHWLLLPEMRGELQYRRIRERARGMGLRIAAIFYDAIPVLRPDLCNEEVRLNHADYLRGLAECDLVLAISHFSESCLREFWKALGITASTARTVQLPGEFGGIARQRIAAPSPTHDVHILCVSTLEPRKNHRSLIEAFQVLQRDHPEWKWILTLVGNRYAGADDLAEFVRQAAADNPALQWLGIVDDDTLIKLYREAHICVYPSLIEGFGLPILESIWHCRPCICSSEGVMAELAKEGGCFTTDVSEPTALADAVYRLVVDTDLYRRLSTQAAQRSLKSWSEYAAEIRAAIETAQIRYGHHHRSESAQLPAPELEPEGELQVVEALLAHQRPRCAMTIGAGRSFETSLLAEYSSSVIFIPTAEANGAVHPKMENVFTINAPARSVLPAFFRQAALRGLPIDFLLVEAGPSPDELRILMASVLALVPASPLLLLLRHGINPDCRRVIIEANWHKSPWCHQVDLDLLPGEQISGSVGEPGRFSGGLSIARFAPIRRAGELSMCGPADAAGQQTGARSVRSIRENKERL